MRKHAVALIVGVLAFGLLVAGCGGGDDNGSSSGATSTASNSPASVGNDQSEGSGSSGPEESSGSEEDAGAASGEGDGGVEGASPENAEFTAKANAICLKSNTKTKIELIRAYRKAEAEGIDTEPEGLKLEATVILPILVADAEAQVDGIRSLEVPSGDEEQVEAILAAYQKWIDEAKADPGKTSRAGETFAEARELAGKYPLVKCGLSPFEV